MDRASRVRLAGREVQVHTIIGRTALTFQRQTLGAHTLAALISAPGIGKRLWRIYSVNIINKDTFRSEPCLIFFQTTLPTYLREDDIVAVLQKVPETLDNSL